MQTTCCIPNALNSRNNGNLNTAEEPKFLSGVFGERVLETDILKVLGQQIEQGLKNGGIGGKIVKRLQKKEWCAMRLLTVTEDKTAELSFYNSDKMSVNLAFAEYCDIKLSELQKIADGYILCSYSFVCYQETFDSPAKFEYRFESLPLSTENYVIKDGELWGFFFQAHYRSCAVPGFSNREPRQSVLYLDLSNVVSMSRYDGRQDRYSEEICWFLLRKDEIDFDFSPGSCIGKDSPYYAYLKNIQGVACLDHR